MTCSNLRTVIIGLTGFPENHENVRKLKSREIPNMATALSQPFWIVEHELEKIWALYWGIEYLGILYTFSR